MKKLMCIFCLILMFFIGGYFIFVSPQTKQEYIRIHVRANSNYELDQNIKYQIKDKVVEFLTPVFASCTTKTEFVEKINNNLINVEKIANDILKQNNFNYTAKANFRNEEFPTRSYDGVVLESGFYDSIILELGEAKGDNWWCVVYPPLCFLNSSSSKVEYRSKLAEIVKNVLG